MSPLGGDLRSGIGGPNELRRSTCSQGSLDPSGGARVPGCGWEKRAEGGRQGQQDDGVGRLSLVRRLPTERQNLSVVQPVFRHQLCDAWMRATKESVQVPRVRGDGTWHRAREPVEVGQGELARRSSSCSVDHRVACE